MNEHTREIEQRGEQLAVGESARGLCPFCRGGGSGEHSFRVLRIEPALLHYKCFRAKCGRWGYAGSAKPPVAESRKPRGLTYDGPTSELPRAVYRHAPVSNSGKRLADFLSYKECEEQGFLYGIGDARILMPLYDHTGRTIGVSARGVGGQRNPRNITLHHEPYSGFHCPRQNSGILDARRVVVCEDILSSIVVSRITTAASSMGTGISRDALLPFRGTAVEQIDIFFDGDTAGYKAGVVALRQVIGMGYEGMIIPCPLGSDPKDLDRKTLEMLLHE